MLFRSNPFITIVTVCYNSEKTIERTIKSVLSQQFTDYEYLIVDGVSKDTTLSIIQKYEPLFNGHMKWRSEPDKGIYDAFNKGCKWASGKYVWIVNSDDYMEPDALTKIWEVDQQQNTQQAKNTILIGRMNYISVDGTLFKHMRQIILAHAQSLRHHTQRDRLTVVCIQIAPHAVRQHRRHFTLLLLLVDTTAEQGIGQIQHCLCQTAAHGMQVSRIGAEQIQQVHGLAYLPGKLSARYDRTLPFCDQTVGRQTFYIDIGNCDAVRPDLPHLIGFLAVQHTLITDNNVVHASSADV